MKLQNQRNTKQIAIAGNMDWELANGNSSEHNTHGPIKLFYLRNTKYQLLNTIISFGGIPPPKHWQGTG